MKASKKWRWNFTLGMPEEVKVFPAGGKFVLVEGEDHTSYAGGFFDTPEEVFSWEINDATRAIRHATHRKDRILLARDRFFEQHQKQSP